MEGTGDGTPDVFVGLRISPAIETDELFVGHRLDILPGQISEKAIGRNELMHKLPASTATGHYTGHPLAPAVA